MSDLLSRMIRRASGAVSPVEPLLASRYEPVEPVLPPPALDPHPSPVPEERIVAAEPPRQLPPQSRPPLARIEARPRDVRPPAVQPIIQRNQPPAPVPVPIAPEPQPAMPASPPEAVLLEAPPAGPAPQPEIVAPPSRAPMRAEAPAPTRPTEAEPSREPAAPDEIHVTIGHIELRMAPPAPKTTPPRRPATPRVTLDDYLRRRSGGAR